MDRVTAPTPDAMAQLLASSHTSLMHGWVPITVQVVTGIVLALAVGWRSRRWRMVCLPAAAVGGTVAYGDALVHRRSRSVRRTGAGRAVALDRDDGYGRDGADSGLAQRRTVARGAAPGAVPLCLLSAALVLNLWVGYFPTVQSAWNQLTSGPLPDQTDQATVTAMAAKGSRPSHGSVVPVRDPLGRIAFQASRRTGVPAARMVRQSAHRRRCRP